MGSQPATLILSEGRFTLDRMSRTGNLGWLGLGAHPAEGQHREGQGVEVNDRRGTTAAVLAGLLSLTGCSGNGVQVQSPPIPTASVTSPVATPAATGFPEEPQILAQYRGFYAALTPASKVTPAERLEMLRKFATDPSLTRTLGGLAAATAAGEVLYGRDVLRPDVVNVVGTTATIRDCQDTSGFGRVKVSTGKKVTVGVKNTLAIVVMKRGTDGVWRVSTVENKPAGSCSAGA